MRSYIWLADRISLWFGKAFAWAIMIMAFGMGYEVFVRYWLGRPTAWAFDMSYMMYGTLFMMGGAYALSRDAHVRADFIYRLWRPRTQATVELVLYFLFFFPGIIAFIAAGWKYASRSLSYLEVSVMSPANIPIFQFKMIIVAAGVLLLIQGIARVFRCIICLREGLWPPLPVDVEEMEERLIHEREREVLRHGSESVDALRPGGDDDAGRPRRPAAQSSGAEA
jgi:TRAP-type mannitol/chloroaromatic compound transport system permease small subunit